MSELDLSEACEAGYETELEGWGANRIIDAALPHIIEALADEAMAQRIEPPTAQWLRAKAEAVRAKQG